MISVTPYGAIGFRSDNGQEFKVNGKHLKYYIGEELDFKENIQLMCLF